MANMTVQTALAEMPSMPAELHAFVKQQLLETQGDAQAFLQAQTAKSRTSARVSSQASATAMNADKAREVLNRMTMSTMEKLDMQRAECLSQQAKQHQLLDDTEQDITSFNSQGTSARAQVMATQTSVKRLQEMLPKLNHELALNEAKCKQSVANLKKQISLIQADSATLASVVSSTKSCSSLLQTGLLHCHRRHHRKSRRHSGESFITFRHHALRYKAAQLKSPTVRSMLQEALAQVYPTDLDRELDTAAFARGATAKGIDMLSRGIDIVTCIRVSHSSPKAIDYTLQNLELGN
jgi:hypothetical protein